MVVVGGPGYSVVDGRSIAVAGAGASAGGASAGGGGLMGMCYERYEDGSTQSITYAGAGRGDLETKMVTVGVGQGSYKAVETPNYSYRPRWPVICSCCCFGLLLILLPLLFLFCEVRSFFTGEICGDPGQYDACEDRCSLANFREFEQSFCCAECPERIPALGFQCSAPQPAEVHDVVRRHYNTVYHAIPENHYVKVQMPPQPPLIRTVHMMTPPRTYHCASDIGSQPDPDWSNRHVRWCCYKYKEWCPHTVVDKDYYHTVTKVARVRVPVPEPMPTHAPIVRTIHRTYHVPSPPNYVHVHVPGPTVVKPVVVHDRVPVPFHEPPKVIDVKKPYPVHVKGPDHFVKVPVPSPPHVVTQYHTKWNTVIDQTYDCHNGLEDWGHLWSHSKKSWCCDHQDVGCGHWEKVVHVVQTYDCHAGFKSGAALTSPGAAQAISMATGSITSRFTWSNTVWDMEATTARLAPTTGSRVGQPTRRTGAATRATRSTVCSSTATEHTATWPAGPAISGISAARLSSWAAPTPRCRRLAAMPSASSRVRRARVRSAWTGPRNTSSDRRKKTPATWPTARCRWNAMCAAHAPLRPLAVASRARALSLSIAMRRWATSVGHGPRPRRSGAATTSRRAASLRTRHRPAMQAPERSGTR